MHDRSDSERGLKGDSKRLVRMFYQLPMLKPHFAWGPVNSVVFLLGVGLTAVALNLAGELPSEIGIAVGIAAIVLLIAVQLRQRWDALLGSSLSRSRCTLNTTTWARSFSASRCPSP